MPKFSVGQYIGTIGDVNNYTDGIGLIIGVDENQGTYTYKVVYYPTDTSQVGSKGTIGMPYIDPNHEVVSHVPPSGFTLANLAPMPMKEGPPLPRFLGIFWPWYKPLPKEILKVVTPTGTETHAPVVVIAPPAPPAPPAEELVPLQPPPERVYRFEPIRPATLIDIATLPEVSQGVLQLQVEVIPNAQVVTVGTVVAVITPTGVGSVIYPTETTTPEELKQATAAVQEQLVQAGAITVEPKTGIATPVVSTTVTDQPTFVLTQQGVSASDWEFIKASIRQTLPPEWVAQFDVDVNKDPKPQWVGGVIRFPNVNVNDFLPLAGSNWPVNRNLSLAFSKVEGPANGFAETVYDDRAYYLGYTAASAAPLLQALWAAPDRGGYKYLDGYVYFQGFEELKRAKATL